MFPTLQIGPLSLQTPGLILLIGLWVGISLSERYAKRFKSDSELISNLIFYSLLAAIIGARLSYALQFPSAFSENPSSLISLNPGLLDPWGAAAGALITALVYGQRKALSLHASLDALTPSLAALAIAVALSNLASGQGYGMPSTLPWTIDLWGTARHPSQIYEALSAAAILFYMLSRRVSRKGKRTAGLFFFEFVALSAGSRLFQEAFRGDSLLLPTGWRATQVIAWLIMAASLYLLTHINGKAPAKK